MYCAQFFDKRLRNMRQLWKRWDSPFNFLPFNRAWCWVLHTHSHSTQIPAYLQGSVSPKPATQSLLPVKFLVRHSPNGRQMVLTYTGRRHSGVLEEKNIVSSIREAERLYLCWVSCSLSQSSVSPLSLSLSLSLSPSLSFSFCSLSSFPNTYNWSWQPGLAVLGQCRSRTDVVCCSLGERWPGLYRSSGLGRRISTDRYAENDTKNSEIWYGWVGWTTNI